MAFCSFSNESARKSATSVDNNFICRYMPHADGDAVKVYLYGLCLCSQSGDFSIEAMAEALSFSVEYVRSAFFFWADYGLVSIVSESPFLVRYHSERIGEPRKLKPEKYTGFNQQLQEIFPEREISVSEYGHYMSFLEEQPIRQDALIMIVRYCREYTNDPNINFKYVKTTALNFIQRGILTAAQVEKELSFYSKDTDNLRQIFRALNLKRKPDVADGEYLKAWRKMEFEFENILFAASRLKRGNLEKLDAVLKELYANRCFSREEIDYYLSRKEALLNETYRIAKKLGVYLSYAETYMEKYTSGWAALGYSDEALDSIADYSFAVKKRSFEGMDEVIRNWYEKGVVSLESIQEHLALLNKSEKFLSEILKLCQISRRPTAADHDALGVWQSWGFDEDMIRAAAKESVGKANPIPYMSAILSSWKAKNVHSVGEIPLRTSAEQSTPKTKRVTSKEEMDALIAEVAKRYQV